MKKILVNISKKELEQAYITNKKTQYEIGLMFGYSRWCIRQKLLEYQIPLRRTNELKIGITLSENHKKKISNSIKGENHPWFGKKHSEKTRKLQSKVKLGINNPNYVDGTGGKGYSVEFNEILKESIRKRDGYNCQLCQMTQEESYLIFGRDLDVHHIDYDKTNNILFNLITLCKTCHARTNFNREYWENNLCHLIHISVL